ncbi:MAG: hypothetical protein IMZ64_06720, partial [Bacteroidetes bacterium]|nr:hypothetical protein [Bacteroidota bacterium]
MQLSKIINKQEAMYTLFASIFAVVWFVLLLPSVIKLLGDSLAAIQFILFNLGLYFFFFIFLKAIVTRKPSGSKMKDIIFQLKTSLGLVFLVMGLDIWMPEYHVTIEGTLLSGANIGVGASDYIIGLLGKTIGIPGIFLYLFT